MPAEQPTIGVKFVCAGTAACMADMITFPLDTAKVRLQIQGEGNKKITGSISKSINKPVTEVRYKGVFGTISTIARVEGPRALYNGVSAGLQRQMCFASIRLGLYDSVRGFYQTTISSDLPGFNVVTRILAGMTTGATAILFAQPTDVVKVRLQAQNKAGGAKRYSGAFDAYKKIVKADGVRGLWRGTLPNIARNAVINSAELVVYDLTKETIIKRRILPDSLPCHFASAIFAGFVATCVASPIDVVKTRFMNSNPGLYSGAIDCAAKMFKEGGIKSFYKGFIPSFMRLGSWNVFMFIFYEQLKKRVMEHKKQQRIQHQRTQFA
ncbi:dicarboxylate carrier UCP2-like [Saccoglossus kowalevskii]|uniref:Mitochondrial uncoupling protein 2-like isoform X1 n=1 Tax=Saccoglossus kowalevskii TaxID=10224 RepID=A0ABM0GYU3_SACKO|nr:PREDICTED: mitochondrial uncoupling protein 2-like isoform X1 [Saccoglossus kowalevskii]XP_006823706.1 PREDICTED: mitochondrial uncoupling protein 2-like isoform X2 [Saccoglossus kowalevskii]